MQELGLDLDLVRSFFDEVDDGIICITVSAVDADTWPDVLASAMRLAYISDHLLTDGVAATGKSPADVVAAKLPTEGSIKSGDFAEFLAALFLGAREVGVEVLDAKKLRLKYDRDKASPRTDVVQFHLPDWPNPSDADRVVSAEAKGKATRSDRNQAEAAVQGSVEDRDGRLAKTLVWLRERALGDGYGGTLVGGTVTHQHLDRFVEADAHPPYQREFNAVLIICESLVDEELNDLDLPAPDESRLFVISVPDLKDRYEAMLAAVLAVAEDLV